MATVFARLIRFRLVWLAMLCGCVPLLAQSRNYHAEIANEPDRRFILVNDSKEPIEAFHASVECHDPTSSVEIDMRVSSEETYDALAGSRKRWWLWDGLTAKGDVVEPGERFNIGGTLNAVCNWEPNVDAVIYADGSYDGNELAVRRLQARRDGLATGVKFWADKLNRDTPHGSDLDAMVAVAKRMASIDSAIAAFSEQHTLWLPSSYWRGRHEADGPVAERLQRMPKDHPEQSYEQLVQFVTGWQREIEDNLALKRLEVTFPLPTPLIEQATRSWEKEGSPIQ